MLDIGIRTAPVATETHPSRGILRLARRILIAEERSTDAVAETHRLKTKRISVTENEMLEKYNGKESRDMGARVVGLLMSGKRVGTMLHLPTNMEQKTITTTTTPAGDTTMTCNPWRPPSAARGQASRRIRSQLRPSLSGASTRLSPAQGNSRA